MHENLRFKTKFCIHFYSTSRAIVRIDKILDGYTSSIVLILNMAHGGFSGVGLGDESLERMVARVNGSAQAKKR